MSQIDSYSDLMRWVSGNWPPTQETTMEVREVYNFGTMPVRRDVMDARRSDHLSGLTREIYRGIDHAVFDEKWLRARAINTEENNMDRTTIIQSRLAELENELAKRKVYGTDEYAEGSVLQFRGDHGVEGGTKYTWAAVKAGGTWHVTGNSSPSNLTWSALVDFFLKANVTKLWPMRRGDRLI